MKPPEVSATRLTFPFGGTTGSREDGDELRRTSRAFWMPVGFFRVFFPIVSDISWVAFLIKSSGCSTFCVWCMDNVTLKILAWILDPLRSGGCDACPQGHGSEWCNVAWQNPTKKGRKRLKHHEEDEK